MNNLLGLKWFKIILLTVAFFITSCALAGGDNAPDIKEVYLQLIKEGKSTEALKVLERLKSTIQCIDILNTLLEGNKFQEANDVLNQLLENKDPVFVEYRQDPINKVEIGLHAAYFRAKLAKVNGGLGWQRAVHLVEKFLNIPESRTITLSNTPVGWEEHIKRKIFTIFIMISEGWRKDKMVIIDPQQAAAQGEVLYYLMNYFSNKKSYTYWYDVYDCPDANSNSIKKAILRYLVDGGYYSAIADFYYYRLVCELHAFESLTRNLKNRYNIFKDLKELDIIYRAQDVYVGWLQSKCNRANLGMSLGKAFFHTRDYKKAAEIISEIDKHKDDYPKEYWEINQYDLHFYNEALKIILDQNSDSLPDTIKLFDKMINYKTNPDEKERVDCKEWLKNRSNLLNLYLYYAKALFQLKKYQDALVYINKLKTDELYKEFLSEEEKDFNLMEETCNNLIKNNENKVSGSTTSSSTKISTSTTEIESEIDEPGSRKDNVGSFKSDSKQDKTKANTDKNKSSTSVSGSVTSTSSNISTKSSQSTAGTRTFRIIDTKDGKDVCISYYNDVPTLVSFQDDNRFKIKIGGNIDVSGSGQVHMGDGRGDKDSYKKLNDIKIGSNNNPSSEYSKDETIEEPGRCKVNVGPFINPIKTNAETAENKSSTLVSGQTTSSSSNISTASSQSTAGTRTYRIINAKDGKDLLCISCNNDVTIAVSFQDDNRFKIKIGDNINVSGSGEVLMGEGQVDKDLNKKLNDIEIGSNSNPSSEYSRCSLLDTQGSITDTKRAYDPAKDAEDFEIYSEAVQQLNLLSHSDHALSRSDREREINRILESCKGHLTSEQQVHINDLIKMLNYDTQNSRINSKDLLKLDELFMQEELSLKVDNFDQKEESKLQKTTPDQIIPEIHAPFFYHGIGVKS